MMNKNEFRHITTPTRGGFMDVPESLSKLTVRKYSIDKLLETDPVRLWNLVHTSGSKVSLTRPTHFKLKQVISDVAPELIVENDVKRELRKSKMKLSKAISSGTIGTDKSSFKRLD